MKKAQLVLNHVMHVNIIIINFMIPIQEKIYHLLLHLAMEMVLPVAAIVVPTVASIAVLPAVLNHPHL